MTMSMITLIRTKCRVSIKAFLTALILLLSIALVFSGEAFAHPEDEFCTPGAGGLDPALCRQLNALQSGDGIVEAAVTGADTASFDVEERGMMGTLWTYTKIGVGHILPGGLDHILFVLALFLSTNRLKPLLIQISAFTVAHTVTLGLAAAGVIAPPASIVEPLIAATIALVAVENLVFKEMTRWRPLVVFGFGLVHGMGFAGFFGTLGLPEGQFWPALIGFNVGVEIGQLAVIGLAGAAAFYFKGVLHQAGRDDLYRAMVSIPASALIGAIGLWWTVERLVA